MPANALMASWTRDLTSLVPDALPEHVATIGSDLLARWEEPQRHYHRLNHLVELFWAVDELEDAAEIDAGAALLSRIAGWFHDAVYDPSAADGANEAESAWLAVDTLTRFGVADQVVKTVESLIALTASHLEGLSTPLKRAFHDADLWIFAAEPDRFDSYCAQVRREYAHVPARTYRTERARVLRMFADRDVIYQTGYAKVEWEPRAVANLERELSRLHAARG